MALKREIAKNVHTNMTEFQNQVPWVFQHFKQFLWHHVTTEPMKCYSTLIKNKNGILQLHSCYASQETVGIPDHLSCLRKDSQYPTGIQWQFYWSMPFPEIFNGVRLSGAKTLLTDLDVNKYSMYLLDWSSKQYQKHCK